VEAALKPSVRGFAAATAAVALIVMLGLMIFTGKSPTLGNLVRFAPKGLVAAAPQAIARVEIRIGREHFVLDRRDHASWAVAGAAVDDGYAADLGSHVEAALRFMHVSDAVRSLDPDAYGATGLGEFGLDPPAYVVSLSEAGRPVATAQFGILNPPGTSQYVRLLGSAKVNLMPRHVGAEWQVVTDMARRIAARIPGADAADQEPRLGLLLPTSIDHIWAVELVTAGRLTRFERDSAGRCFLHAGQHSHVGNADAHVADPTRAMLIGTALDALNQSEIEATILQRPAPSELSRYGLALPAMIVLLYPRDSSTPLARIEVGAAAGDGFSRYALLAGTVVRVADHDVKRLTDLLKAVGAAT
jgi:hypothetical protein